MMHKWIINVFISVLLVSSAYGQEYYCTEFNPSRCYRDDFTGFFFGGNVGVFSHVARRNDLDGFLTDNSGWTTVHTNVAGGVQAGYDWQCGNRLLGLMADWNKTNAGTRLKDDPNDATDDNSIHNKLDWFTTIRGRAGVALNHALIYLTAGAVFARFETRWTDAPDRFRPHNTRWGWTGGLGTEFIFCDTLSMGAELLFMHFDDKYRSFIDSNETRFTFGHNDSCWNGRISINYRL
ncbi:MAG: porin family protein [Chlamydiales bacterium]